MRIDASDIADLRPVIEATVDAVLAARAADEAKLDHRRIGYTEAQAAEALGIPGHVLGDARRRGVLAARKIGKCFIYSRQTLVDFLRGRDE